MDSAITLVKTQLLAPHRSGETRAARRMQDRIRALEALQADLRARPPALLPEDIDLGALGPEIFPALATNFELELVEMAVTACEPRALVPVSAADLKPPQASETVARTVAPSPATHAISNVF